MSWSLPTIKDEAAHIAKSKIANDQNLPQSVKDYVSAGIDGLIAAHDDNADIPVSVHGYGHICTGPGSYEVTTATIEVKRGEQQRELA